MPIHKDTIQVWRDSTTLGRPYIVSVGADGEAPRTLGVYRTHGAAMRAAVKMAAGLQLQIIDETDEEQ